MKPWVLTGEPEQSRRSYGWVGFVVAFVLLAGVAGLAYERLAHFRGDIQWSNHTHRVIESIEECRADLLAAASMRSAYRNSLDPADRTLMEARIADTNRCIDDLAGLVRDNSVQVVRVSSLQPLIQEREQIIHSGLDLPRTELQTQEVRDQQRAIQARGNALAKQIRAVFETMRAEEQRLLGEREAKSLSSARSTQLAILLGGAFGLTSVALFYFSLLAGDRKRLKIQDDLQRTNYIVSAVIEGSLAAIVVKDREGRYLLANQYAADYLRRDLKDVLGKTVTELMSPEAARTIMESDRMLMESGASEVIEQTLTNHGQTTIFLSTKSPFRDAAGNVIGVIAISRDITERKRMETLIAEQNVERGQNIKRLERQTAEMEILSEMGTFLQTANGDQEAFDVIAHCAMRLFGRPGGLSVIAPSASVAETMVTWGSAQLAQSYGPTDCQALRKGLKISGGDRSIPGSHFGRERGQCIPLTAQGETRGVMHLLGEPAGDAAPAMLAAFTEQLSLALANMQLRETLRAQAIRDPLTGLYNRRYMDETLAREIGRAQRKNGPLSVAMIDLDHFKRLNDTFGHAAGDAVLKQFAQLVLRSVRREDIACRYGGEEFLVILPDLPAAKALERAEQWRADVERLHMELEGKTIGPLTASFGIASIPAHGKVAPDLLAAADSALYRAKHEGRNCVLMAEGPATFAA